MTDADSLMTEAQLQAAIVDMCRTLGLLVYHTHDSRRAQPGWPDLVILGRRLIIRELKTARGRVRPEQHVWISRLSRAGVDAGIWRPQDLTEGRILETLRSIR